MQFYILPQLTPPASWLYTSAFNVKIVIIYLPSKIVNDILSTCHENYIILI